MNATKACQNCDNEQIAKAFFEQLLRYIQLLNTDIQAIFNGDPAAQSEFEVIRTYPGFFASHFTALQIVCINIMCLCCRVSLPNMHTQKPG